MKFAKEIDDDAIPEWKDKYLNYKEGKKLIKSVAKAVRSTHTPPAPLVAPSPTSTPLLLPGPAIDDRGRQRRGSFLSRTRTLVYGTNGAQPESTDDVPLHSRLEVSRRLQGFREYLDREYEKIETFYVAKEEESKSKLDEIREQLHFMRDQHAYEQAHGRPGRGIAPTALPTGRNPIDRVRKRVHWGAASSHDQGKKDKPTQAPTTPGSTSLATPPVESRIHQGDYERRPLPNEVPYLTAKRRLKHYMIEYHRSLELLKSYSFMNHKAFRKVNKKYDKAVNAAKPLQYFNEKVSKAHFAQSEIVESHIREIEDLYARYYERGNRKIAVAKLRRKNKYSTDYTASTFRIGFLVAAGLTLGIEGLYYGAKDLLGSDAALSSKASFLLQIYGGYFLMLFLMLLFALDCIIFDQAHVNYVFIFEFDTRSVLDWRQLFEIPCLFLSILGLTLLLNFMHVGGAAMYTYWPVILVGVTVILIFLPAPYLYHRTRLWFVKSLARLFAAPFPRVEFRDFFLGDMLCSQTFSMGNIELFFCLYAGYWNQPNFCNSSHSRLLGFFSAWPGILRFLQCLRRYNDTRSVFPHLVNGGKYTFTFMQYATLSIYRVSRSTETFAAFCAVATINSVYCTIWDIVMDWSLLHLQRDMKNPKKWTLLRQNRAYKNVWAYIAAMIIDPILRFNWILYVIFKDDVQHSSLVSFIVALTEVLRRGMWTLFRVENEHCANIARNRASRDLPLPYTRQSEEVQEPGLADHEPQGQNEASMEEARDTPAVLSPSLRSKKSTPRFGVGRSPSIVSRVGIALSRAHTQDFERRRDLDEQFAQEDEDDDDDDDEYGEVSDEDHKTRSEAGRSMDKDAEESVPVSPESIRLPGPARTNDEAARSARGPKDAKDSATERPPSK